MITVFTPTYNRSKTLSRLYQSLIGQTDKNFEWLIIDDGSTDNTEEVVRGFIAEGKLDINYVKRENWGLSQTINQGVDLAKGDIFFRIDSDDFATLDSIELINKNWHIVEADEKLCGLVFLKESLVSSQSPYSPFTDNFRTNFFDFRNIYKGKGDMAEVVRTDVLKKYKLPKFGDEKFCPEGLMWNRIALDYDAVYIPKVIYRFEYIEDGFTQNVRRNLRRNPKGISTFFSEIFDHKTRFPYFLKNSISYWRYAFVNGNGFLANFKKVPFLVSFLGMAPGFLLCKIDGFSLK